MTFAFLFFDSVGGGEWLVLLAVILIVVGPKNLPAAARKMGQVLSQLRRAADEFKRQIMTMDQEMERVVSDVKKDYIEIADDVDKTVADAADDAKAAVEDGGEGNEDRAYDYYGDDYSDETGEGDYYREESAADAGPEMAEHSAESATESAGAPVKAPPSEAELKAVHITVSTAADRGAKA